MPRRRLNIASQTPPTRSARRNPPGGSGCRHREGGLHGRLVERRKRPARVRRLELRDGVLAIVRTAEIKTAQLVVEASGIADRNCGRPRRDWLGHTQRRRFLLWVERYRSCL